MFSVQTFLKSHTQEISDYDAENFAKKNNFKGCIKSKMYL